MQHARPSARYELRQIWRKNRPVLWAVAVFSFFANLLMLTGPLYMMQVYDRVLGSGSVPTLMALSGVVVFLYAMMALLDYARGRALARIGAQLQRRLDSRVFQAMFDQAMIGKTQTTGLRDLESIQRLIASPATTALFDLPWTPIFIVAIWAFHPMLGILALVGGGGLVILTLANQVMSRNPLQRAAGLGLQSDQMSDQMLHNSDLIRALGMQGAVQNKWASLRDKTLRHSIRAADIGGSFTSLSRAMRLLLQSAMLGLGAYLAVQGALSAGAMIAGSLLLGRALAPVEQLIAQWPLIARAMQGRKSLNRLLKNSPKRGDKTPLPRPKARLDVQQITLIPPNHTRPSLRMVSFALTPGQACGVIGPSGAGKSSLARALTGVWEPTAGAVRLDGAALDQYDPDVLGSYVGYLPQNVQLFAGSIGDNIARLSTKPDINSIHLAAKRAGAYDMILSLPDGFDTQIDAHGGCLSGGQVQRIALARAMYGEPVLLILDEPNSNLDNDGNAALNAAIRDYKSLGHTVLIMAHRPAAIQECDLLLMIEDGKRRAFGPKEQILREMVQNHSHLNHPNRMAGVA